MTYGLRPENWPAFEAELSKRNIAESDIERFEIRPQGESDAAEPAGPTFVEVTVTLHSGRVESWRQPASA
jgi:hypothetical protein